MARALLAAVALGLAINAWSDPRVDYLLHCSGCHLPDGSGNPPEVPTLHDELARIVQSPEGRGYLARVPGSSQAPISDEKLAAVINWILVEFNGRTLPDDFEPLSAREVGESRKQILADPIKYRAQFWPEY